MNVDVGLDRQTGKERSVFGIWRGQFDADRQTLNDFHEISRRVFGGQESQGRTGPKGKSGNASFENVVASVHIDIQINRLTDAKLSELRFLEIGVDPDVGQGANGHDALSGHNVIAGIDVPPGDHAVDVGNYIRIAEIQFRLCQIALRLGKLGLGLLDLGAFFRRPA